MQLSCPSRSCISWTTDGIMPKQRIMPCMRQWRWRWRAKNGGGSWGWRFNIVGALSVRHITSNAEDKPAICTADELHYVSVPGTEWQLALWRYAPTPGATSRNHPLLLLSGVGTNAIGYDLSPGYSFARHMSGEGFDTWILEVRGAGLSKRQGLSNSQGNLPNGPKQDLVAPIDVGVTDGSLTIAKQSALEASDLLGTGSSDLDINKSNSRWDESELVSKLSDIFMRLAERLSGFLSEGQSRIVSAKLFDQISDFLEDAQLLDRFNEVRGKISGLLEARQNSAMAGQIRDLSQRLVNIIEDGQKSMSPQLYDLQERLATTLEDFQKQLDLIVKYDWDFDHYLKEDVPTAMRYILAETKPKDGKLLAIGHSMGGILLYSMLSHHGFEGSKATLAAVVTLAASLDYTPSNSSLKLLLPLADPAQALNVPVVPLGALLSAAYPLCTRPPYVLSWLNPQISAGDMMHPELFEKLVLKNFCTIPAKVLLQLTTAFRSGGLRDRSGNFFYKDHLHNCDVPVLALAGDEDLICPPIAVYETVKFIPAHLVTYKVFGGKDGHHYAHYDLVGGRLAKSEVYPCIIEFLARHDVVDTS
ncbi:uncharacterized protein LOC116248730 [Nymphaea colorata]|nr:uncharacterized protein LOC116248730 [Nymphaea colorata]XP_031477546.1 uncharacterized protein LOC116248730 [Nymphaea colorata]XP_031477547.1 uncharacterized protein LOC116248730 [Nymphaea colorata]XP_031477548.1 uncharacterized protein LOC116248730 [Nymphaea colorata]XP_031477549.1 uncharacterized protein LOC116248730 [Nymphaea colorata]